MTSLHYLVPTESRNKLKTAFICPNVECYHLVSIIVLCLGIKLY